MKKKQKLFRSVALALLVSMFQIAECNFTGGVIAQDHFQPDKMLISASKNLMNTRKAPAIATVITEDEIRNTGAGNLMDILSKIPGLSIIRHASMQRLEIRGIQTPYSEKVLLMIDGHRLNNNFDGTAMFVCNDLIVENIKQVEVIRGPGSALFGTGAFACLINVITKTAGDINGQQVSVTAGSFSTEKYNALFSHANNKVEISGHLNYLKTDGQSHLIEEDALKASGDTLEWKEKTDFGLKIKYGDFGLNGRVIDKKRGPYIGNGYALNDETVYDYVQFLGDLTCAKNITDDLDLSARLFTDYYNSDMFHEIFPEGFTGGDDKGFLGRFMFKNRSLGAEITANYVSGNHLLTAGTSYEHVRQYDVRSMNNATDFFSDISESPNFTQNADRDIFAFYLQDIWKISACDSLTLGVRYDRYDDFGSIVSTRAGYVHEFRNNMILKLLYGSGFRVPSFFEIYRINSPVLEGNPDLDPEKINTYEVGLEYPFLKHYTLKLNYFHSDIKDLIGRGPLTPSMPAQYINSEGKARSDGAEAELDLYLGTDNYGYINASYQHTRDENGETIPDAAEWKANAGLNYRVFKYLNANINISWTGERPRAEGDPRDDLSSNTLVDLTLIAKGFCKTLEISGSVYNLFNEDYRDPSDLRIPNDFPYHERMFLAEVRYKF
ncbi:MAG: TonB-dependent receptor [Desulfobacterales bacterium]|nr:TonB-dependent receptor [Desulfobacterales bacterium]